MLREMSSTATLEHSFETRSRPTSRGDGIELSIKYIDPSYTIRSVRTNPHDSVFCLLLGMVLCMPA